jgi:hypothetical protein
MHSGFEPRWTNGEDDDLHLNNEEIRNLVEGLEVKLKVQVAKEKKPGLSTNDEMEKTQSHIHRKWRRPKVIYTGNTCVHHSYAPVTCSRDVAKHAEIS